MRSLSGFLDNVGDEIHRHRHLFLLENEKRQLHALRKTNLDREGHSIPLGDLKSEVIQVGLTSFTCCLHQFSSN